MLFLPAGVSGMKGGCLDQCVRDLGEAVKVGERVYCLDNQFLASIHDAYAMVLAATGQHHSLHHHNPSTAAL